MKSTTILLLVCFLLLSCNLCKAEWLLSDSAKVSFINCKAGDKPYSAFGHSALRFTDSLNQFDVVFNYGAFNSGETDFYINFLSGNLNFYLVIERMQEFYPALKFWIFATGCFLFWSSKKLISLK